MYSKEYDYYKIYIITYIETYIHHYIGPYIHTYTHGTRHTYTYDIQCQHLIPALNVWAARI